MQNWDEGGLTQHDSVATHTGCCLHRCQIRGVWCARTWGGMGGEAARQAQAVACAGGCALSAGGTAIYPHGLRRPRLDNASSWWQHLQPWPCVFLIFAPHTAVPEELGHEVDVVDMPAIDTSIIHIYWAAGAGGRPGSMMYSWGGLELAEARRTAFRS